MLELLGAAAFNHRGHRFEGAILGLRQPAQVTVRHCRVVPCPGSEKMPVTVQEPAERCGHPIDQ